MKNCPDCNNPVDDEAIFCDRCGYRIIPLPTPARENPAPAASAAPAWNAPLPPTNPPVSPSRVGSKFCPTCGYMNPVGETYCDNCGFWLVGQYSITASVPNAEAAAIENILQNQAAQPSYETSVGIKAVGRLLSQATNTFIPLLPKNELLLGRRDPERKIYPDIDLSGQGSGSNSVSRLHARLIVQGVLVYVEDLNSTNGTYLNRQRLQGGQRHLLKNGDELRLGGLVLIYQSD